MPTRKKLAAPFSGRRRNPRHRAAAEGHSDVMVALGRDSSTFLTPLESVARTERLLPADWIHPDGNDVRPAFREYAAPLTGDLPAWPRLL